MIASEPTQCLLLTHWDFLAALRESDVEMSIMILQELAKRFRRALDSLQEVMLMGMKVPEGASITTGRAHSLL